MSIVGLTDSVVVSFQRLGKLYKGGPKTASGFGADLEYFRFNSDNPAIMAAFADAYGTQPKVINCFIPHATPEQAFPNWCEVWGKTGLVHRCDGQTMSVWLNGDKYERGVKPCMGGHEKGDPLNDAVGRLDVIIPELVAAGFVGYVTLETHGKHDILNIVKVLGAVHQSRIGNEAGLRGVPFVLRRVRENISIPGYGKTEGQCTRADKWLVKLEPSSDWLRVQIEMSRMEALNMPQPDRLALPAGDVVDAATGELVAPKAPATPAKPAAPKPQPPVQKTAATKPNGNGNGAKTRPTLQQFAAKWDQLVAWAQALGVDADLSIEHNATIEQYIARGKALKPKVVEIARPMSDPMVNYQNDDDIIKSAIAMLQQYETEPVNG